jgi:outer membrane protein OmpA-like peptidoglycan-associated protein
VNALEPRIADLTARVIDVHPAVTQTPAATSITISSDVLFAFGSSDLSPLAQAVLGDVVNRLNSAAAGVVTVTGYTDSIGKDDFNVTLSQARAQAVQAYLASKVTRPGLTYQVVGKGKADPAAPNTNPDGSDNPDGRRQNRRVTVSTH